MRGGGLGRRIPSDVGVGGGEEFLDSGPWHDSQHRGAVSWILQGYRWIVT